MTYSLDIAFDQDNQSTESKIFIKYSTSDDKGITYISPKCTTIYEIEEQINRLHAELDSLLKKAKSKYNK